MSWRLFSFRATAGKNVKNFVAVGQKDAGFGNRSGVAQHGLGRD